MNTTSKLTSAIALTIAALAAGNAFAAEAGDRGLGLTNEFGHPVQSAASNTSRDAVRAEYLRAAAAGEVVASGDRASRLAAPTVAQASGTTREQVRAEYFRAVRQGDIVQSGDIGIKLNQMFPTQYQNADRAERVAATGAAAQL
jgi:hypothetical protein